MPDAEYDAEWGHWLEATYDADAAIPYMVVDFDPFEWEINDLLPDTLKEWEGDA